MCCVDETIQKDIETNQELRITGRVRKETRSKRDATDVFILLHITRSSADYLEKPGCGVRKMTEGRTLK
jgi:hypothetical protein